jgi:serine/threonine-protein kinase
MGNDRGGFRATGGATDKPAQSPAAGSVPDVAQHDPRAYLFGAPAIGSTIAGKYRVDGILGAGGMGMVVAATHEQLGQRVAIKFMKVDDARDEQAVGRFLREARAAVALANEHVTRVLDVGTLENGAPYMVMEYLAGFDLCEMLRREGPLTVPAAVEVLLQACEALAEAHARGIIHRDLKPANLFATVRSDGTRLVKVLDFGISKTVDFGGSGSAQNLTHSGMVMGSPGYMSPEQVRNAKGVDARTDIWALGVILYELLTGVTPFGGDSLGDIIAKIVSQDPPPIWQLRRDLPPDLVATIGYCLARDPNARVQTIADLATRLAPFAVGDAVLSVRRVHALAGGSASAVQSGPSGAPGPAQARTGDRTPTPTDRAWMGSSARASMPPQRHVWLVVVAATLVLGVASVAGFLALRGRMGAQPAPSAAAGAGASSAAPLASASASAKVEVPPAKTEAPAASTAPGASASGREQVVALPPLPSGQPAVIRHPAGGSVGPTVRDRAPSGRADCDPPFTIDSSGVRVPKPECL